MITPPNQTRQATPGGWFGFYRTPSARCACVSCKMIKFVQHFAVCVIVAGTMYPVIVANAETNSVIYFEVGSVHPSIRESYVLPIFDTNQVDEARRIIRGGQQKVVAARIRKTPDEINRNLAVEGFPRWSWSVTNLLGFYDASAEEMDGKPSLVELGPDSYVETGIGFWGFTVIRELGPIPLYLDLRRQGTNFNVFWSGISTNALYTLESQAEGLGTDWLIEASGLPPAKTNQWTLPITAIPRYFRVRADGSGTN